MNRVAREDRLDAPKLMQKVSLLLLYGDHVVIFSYDIDGMQCSLDALEAFCQNSGLTKNVDKTKMMVVRTIQPQRYPMPTYKGEHICVCLIHTLRLGASKYEYPFLGRRPTSRKLLYLGASLRTLKNIYLSIYLHHYHP